MKYYLCFYLGIVCFVIPGSRITVKQPPKLTGQPFWSRNQLPYLCYDNLRIEVLMKFSLLKFTLWNSQYQVYLMKFSETNILKSKSKSLSTPKKEERARFELTTFCLAREDANHYARRTGWNCCKKSWSVFQSHFVNGKLSARFKRLASSWACVCVFLSEWKAVTG